MSELIHGRVPDDELLLSMADAIQDDQILAWVIAHARDLCRVESAWTATSQQVVLARVLTLLTGRLMTELGGWCALPKAHDWFREPCPACCANLRRAYPTMSIAIVLNHRK